MRIQLKSNDALGFLDGLKYLKQSTKCTENLGFSGTFAELNVKSSLRELYKNLHLRLSLKEI